MKKILSLLIALLISTNAFAGNDEIIRLKANGMSLGLANEVDSIYISSGEAIPAATLTSPTISGNLTFSTAAAKIIPGATSLTLRNNADSADTLRLTDAGLLIMPRTATQLVVGIDGVDSDVGNVINAPKYYAFTTSTTSAQAALAQGSADTAGARLAFLKSRATTGSANTVVASGDYLGSLDFYGADGAAFIAGAQIRAVLGATPGTNDMPTRIEFLTTPDGSATPLVRWSVGTTGNLQSDTTNGGNINLNSVGASIAFTATGGTLAVDSGTAASACKGTVTATGTTAVTVSTTCAATGANIIIARTSAPSGTAQCWTDTISNGVSFNFDCSAAETGTYSWWILKEG